MHSIQKAAYIGLIGAAFLLPTAIFAQEGNSTTSRPELRKEVRDMRATSAAERQTLHKEVWGTLETLHDDIRTKRQAVEQEVKGLPRDEAKKALEAFRKESSDARDAARKDIKEKRDEFQKQSEDRKNELKKTLGEIRAQRVGDYFDHMTQKMDAAIDRLDKLADRIESRLNKIHDAGRDVTAQQTMLDTARASIAAAQTAIDNAKTKFAAMSASTTPQEQFADVRTLVSTANTKLKEAHAALVDVINSIKRGQLDVVATSTPSTTQ